MNTLTPKERAAFKRALLAAGTKTRNMDDEALTTAHNDLKGRTVSLKPAPGQPEQAAADKTQAAIREGNAASSAAHEGAKKPASKPDTGKLAGSIEQIIIDAMSKNGALDEGRVIELINEHGTVTTTTHHKIAVTQPGGEKVSMEGAHPKLADLITILSVNENCYLVGEAGSGKTTLASQAAEALKMAFHFTGAIMDKFELLGFEDAGGKYHATPLYHAVKDGGVFLIDEVDCSQPAAIKAFNTSLENGFITFPNGETFQIDKAKTKFIFAANTVGTGANRRYVGGYELDRSTLDRFIQVTVEYDRGIENAMALSAWSEAGGLENSLNIASNWAGIVQDFRALLADRQILALCTPRATRHGCKLLAKGWEVEQVKKTVLYKHLSEDQLKQLGVK